MESFVFLFAPIAHMKQNLSAIFLFGGLTTDFHPWLIFFSFFSNLFQNEQSSNYTKRTILLLNITKLSKYDLIMSVFRGSL